MHVFTLIKISYRMRARTGTILEFLPIRFYYLVAIFNRGWFMLNFHKLNRFVCIKTQKTHTRKQTHMHAHTRAQPPKSRRGTEIFLRRH